MDHWYEYGGNRNAHCSLCGDIVKTNFSFIGFCDLENRTRSPIFEFALSFIIWIKLFPLLYTLYKIEK